MKYEFAMNEHEAEATVSVFLAAALAFAIIWGIKFLSKLFNAPQELYLAEKRRADAMEDVLAQINQKEKQRTQGDLL